MEKRRDEGDNAFRRASEILITVLDNASYVKRNQRLLHDAAVVTVKAACSRSSIHGARKRMKKGMSRRRIAAVLEGLDLKKVEDGTNSILRADAKKRFGRQTLDIAVDTHLIPYHGCPTKGKKNSAGASRRTALPGSMSWPRRMF